MTFVPTFCVTFWKTFIMKTYESTHPWLKFAVDLGKAPHEFWVTLGECQSKIEHIAGVPLRPETDGSMQGTGVQ